MEKIEIPKKLLDKIYREEQKVKQKNLLYLIWLIFCFGSVLIGIIFTLIKGGL